MNLLLTVTGVIFIAKELPLYDTLDICSIRWRLRSLEQARNDQNPWVVDSALYLQRYGFVRYGIVLM